MDKRASCFRGKWKQLYHSASIQLILSVAFTTVAVTGMLFLGVALMLRFSSSSNAMAAESSQRVLAQVNLNLDSYLRNMMRVSDTVYYRVIKNTDLQREDMARADMHALVQYQDNQVQQRWNKQVQSVHIHSGKNMISCRGKFPLFRLQ